MVQNDLFQHVKALNGPFPSLHLHDAFLFSQALRFGERLQQQLAKTSRLSLTSQMDCNGRINPVFASFDFLTSFFSLICHLSSWLSCSVEKTKRLLPPDRGCIYMSTQLERNSNTALQLSIQVSPQLENIGSRPRHHLSSWRSCWSNNLTVFSLFVFSKAFSGRGSTVRSSLLSFLQSLVPPRVSTCPKSKKKKQRHL